MNIMIEIQNIIQSIIKYLICVWSPTGEAESMNTFVIHCLNWTLLLWLELNMSAAISTATTIKQGDSSTSAIKPTLPTVSLMQGSADSQGSQMNPNTAPHVSYKNQLQEFCQKNKLELPQYQSVHEKKSFTCTVRVAGKCFESTNCKTKKGSEQTVARVALQAMGLLQQNQVWWTTDYHELFYCFY